ncbi:hypothetical protein DMENIID0001_021290 [Sergentomyia squamirostris]
MEQVIFTVNGEECRISPKEVAPDMSLNMFLRTRLYLTGTKFMCQEGGCGCCIVTLQGKHPVTGDSFTLAINSCLFLVLSCHDLAVTTIEGLGSKARGYHEMQKRLAEHDGTQCGFCSPGFVMNMFSLYTGKFGSVTSAEIENAFGGNICRCTGYRPILDAWKSFAIDAPPGLQEVCEDIEDLTLTKCPKSGRACFGNCQTPIHIRAAEGATWTKVYTLAQLLTALESSTSGKYRLVAGNTATGIYRMPYDIETFIDVSSVTELRTYTINDTIIMGGNVTITEWMTILQQAADRRSGYMYCLRVRDHIDHMATVPVRNVGTIAGNLMTKHDHPDFYSDPFLLLETVGATITIVDTTGNEVSVTPENFLSINMDKKVITNIIMPQWDPNLYQLCTFKTTDRTQNAQIYMNSGFLFEIDVSTGMVTSSRIVYGGINPSFVHATTLESILNGKNLFDNTTIQAGINAFNTTIRPLIDNTVDTFSNNFRALLALGMFYKAVLCVAPSSRVNPLYRSGLGPIPRAISSGIQTYQTIPARFPLTQPIMKNEALIQCSGEAEYIIDILPHNALWATLVLSKSPMKTIVSIDSSAALAVPGVVAFYSAKDIPGVNSLATRKGPILPARVEKEEVFCSGEVIFNGQPIGMIVAEEMAQAVHAADLVQVTYTDTMMFDEKHSKLKDKFLPTLKQVLDRNLEEVKDRIHHTKTIIGPDAKKEEVHQLINDIQATMDFGPQYHYHMETQIAVAIPVEDGIDLYPSTQWMDFTQLIVAQVLGVKENAINIRVRRIGGAFGGKIFRNGVVACATALACYLLNRPVRMVLPMDTNMRAIGKRFPARIDYKVTFSNTGLVLGARTKVVHDIGATVNDYISLQDLLFTGNAYLSLTWITTFETAKTNAPTNTWMRAPGSTEIIGYIETVMEHIAWTLNADPVRVRMANMSPTSPMRKMYTDFLTQCDYYNRLAAVTQFNQANRWKKRGIATTLMQYNHEVLGPFEALVAIYHADGSVVLSYGGIEMGQGLHTKIIQIASFTLGVPLEKIRVKPPNNVVGANSITTAGSYTTDTVGVAIVKCCNTLKARLAPFLALGKWEDIVQAAYLAHIELIAIKQFSLGEMLPYIIYGIACAEIEVDVLTGEFQLRRVDIIEDTGQSVSPRIDVGQVEGAFIMGMGHWLTEKLKYNIQNGELLTDRSWNYKPPGARDIPVDFRVTLLQTTSASTGVLRSKITSEPAVTMSVVVVSALRYAVNAARKDTGAPNIFPIFHAPTTVEEILQYMGTKNEQYVL